MEKLLMESNVIESDVKFVVARQGPRPWRAPL